ncbi:hypothetical protein H1R20_g4161, partial [Candolleomyces eurysporus]
MASNPLIHLTGPLLMGSLLSFFLNGTFVLQIYHYYMNYSSTDRRAFIFLVGFVVLIEILHTVMSTHNTYQILAEGFGNPEVFQQTPFSGGTLPALNGLGGLCTQLFFAWRISVLSKSILGKLTSALVVMGAFAQCAAAIGVTIQYSLLAQDLSLINTLQRTVIAWLGGSFACDMLISLAMVVILLRTREATAFGGSRNMLNALIVHTIENGAITTACAAAMLITYLGIKQANLYYACFEYILGRLYASVLLATLNGRKRMRRAATSEIELSLERSNHTAGKLSTSALQLRSNSGRNDYNAGHQDSKLYPVAMSVSSTTVQMQHAEESKAPHMVSY